MAEKLQQQNSQKDHNNSDTMSEFTKEVENSVISIDDDDEPKSNHLLSSFEKYSEGPSLEKRMNGDSNYTDNDIIRKSPVKKNVEVMNEIECSEALNQQYDEEHCTDDKMNPNNYDLFEYPLIELGRRVWQSSPDQQHYIKGCLWSPDGTCLLVPVHLDGMHIMELPSDLYNANHISKERYVSHLSTVVHVKESGTVYDFTWYPYMTSSDPDTCCWIVSRQHEPIQMWDAFTGDLRCSYRGYNEVDEVEPAISLLFNKNGSNIFGGYKKSIKIFDTNVPGRDYVNIPVKQTVSCMAVTDENHSYVTTGSWNGFIYHYDLRAAKLGCLFALSGHSGGITWLRYFCNDESNWYLYSGARKDNKILQWDMRNYTKPTQIYERNVSTNQRIYFDFDTLCNKWLVTGDTEGYIKAWNLQNPEDNVKLRLHNDCCNGVNFHPTLPVLATTSGQYHFTNNTTQKQNYQSSDTSIKLIEYENSLLITWLGISI